MMIFRRYTVYNKHDDDKNWLSNQRKTVSIIASARIILLPTVQTLSWTGHLPCILHGFSINKHEIEILPWLSVFGNYQAAERVYSTPAKHLQ